MNGLTRHGRKKRKLTQKQTKLTLNALHYSYYCYQQHYSDHFSNLIQTNTLVVIESSPELEEGGN